MPQAKRQIRRDGSNWTNIVGAAAALGAVWGLDITAEQQAQLVTGIVTLQAVVNAAIRKWRG